jgi:hypothetical protein
VFENLDDLIFGHFCHSRTLLAAPQKKRARLMSQREFDLARELHRHDRNVHR